MKHADYIALKPNAALYPVSGIRIKPIPAGGHITQYRHFNHRGGEYIKLPKECDYWPGEYVWLDAEVVSPDAPDIEPLQPGQAP